MGRQAYLTRLTLGRSAFEPLNSEDIPPVSEDGEEALPIDSPIAYQTKYDQEYDKKGYPQNATSRKLKKQWRNAVNDVLATVGFCVAEGRPGSKASFSAADHQKVEDVAFENSLGIFVSAADWGLWRLSTYWPRALRQRIQAFRFYNQTSILHAIKTEWKNLGPFGFFLGGSAATFLFAVLDISVDWTKQRALHYVLNAADLGIRPRTSALRALQLLLGSIAFIFDISVFLLILPLDIFGTLQRLGFLHFASPLPNLTKLLPITKDLVRSLSATVRDGQQGSQSMWRLLGLIPIIYPWLGLGFHHRIQGKVYQYVWAALPKPTHPDRYSLMGAEEDDLDFDTISGLIDENKPESSDLKMTFSEQLASDLQKIGETFQIVYDRCSNYAKRIPIPFRQQKDHYEIIDETDPFKTPTEVIPDQPLPPPSMNVADNYGFDSSVHNPPNHFSPPSPSPANSPSPNSPSPSTPPSNPSSTAPSNSSSPRALALYSNNEDGTVHVNLTIAVPTQGPPGPENEPRQPQPNPTAPYRNTPPRSPQRRTPSQEGEGAGEDGALMAVQQNPTVYPTPPTPQPTPHHRITALTAHPTDAMAQRISGLITDFLFMPFEALYVRTVALAFLSSAIPSSLTTAGTSAAERWKGEIYAPGSWFGPGLRGGAGGWRAMGDYMGKMLLVQGLEAGMGLVVWQVGVGFTWWIGRKWCAWEGIDVFFASSS